MHSSSRPVKPPPEKRSPSFKQATYHARMPPQRQPRKENAPGPFYVDHTCIDCDTCRWMTPQVFDYADAASAVTSQPSTSQDRHAAIEALCACPTFSIHLTDAKPGEIAAVGDAFPLPITANVYHLGYHDKASYAAAPYLITRPDGGNIMVDVPRYNPRLLKRIREMGGVTVMFLTHRDDVGAHAKWAEELGCDRVIHHTEANSRQGTEKVEIKLQGDGPWSAASLGLQGDDIDILFTPGHTKGCCSLLYKPDSILFTGDHLAYSRRLQRMTMFRAYNWFSVPLQLESIEKLIGVEFTNVLPGHGRRWRFESVEEKDEALKELLKAEQ